MDSETINELSFAHARSLCERIRSRYKALAKPYQPGSDPLSLNIAVVLLGRTQEKLNQQRDEILNFIETNGLGRVLEDKTFIDHIDSIDSDEEWEDEA